MNVVLVGFMGSGKTAVGRRVAHRLGYTFLDTDHFIEDQVGCTIATLFEQKGEPYFRELETRLVGQLHRLHNHVIATGGGLPVSPGNSERLGAAGRTVFLNADPEEILVRLERDTRRPKLKGGNLRETVWRLLEERTPIYAQCDIVIDTKGKSVNRVAGELIAFLAEGGGAKDDTGKNETGKNDGAERKTAKTEPTPTAEAEAAVPAADDDAGRGARQAVESPEEPEEPDAGP